MKKPLKKIDIPCSPLYMLVFRGIEMFDSFKKLFGKGQKGEEKSQQINLIDEEIDEYERELQEYISYTEHPQPTTPVSQPTNLAKGGGVTSSSIITPEEEKRIKENS